MIINKFFLIIFLSFLIMSQSLIAEDFVKQDQQCVKDWATCTLDSDCVIIQKRCELIIAVNKIHEAEAHDCLVQHEMAIDCALDKLYLDEDLSAVCDQGQCQIIKMNNATTGELWDTR